MTIDDENNASRTEWEQAWRSLALACFEQLARVARLNTRPATGWHGRSAPVQWTDEAAELNFVDLMPRCMQPCCHPVPQPGIGPETMRQVVQAAREHPRFTPPRHVTVAWAPPGTDPRDTGWTGITGISSVRTGGRAYAMEEAANDAARCITGECT